MAALQVLDGRSTMQRKAAEKVFQALRHYGAGLVADGERLVIEGHAPADILMQAHRHRRALLAMVRKNA
ncbi:hypothetical protein [Niveispirillum irakense]|uniref:hypothetical protein n=1 Tax=Niveispirillum irakense TaxID=34011 RepID=UPI0012B605B2|nr:hypothetical protein [Niveispirillum irakense]